MGVKLFRASPSLVLHKVFGQTNRHTDSATALRAVESPEFIFVSRKKIKKVWKKIHQYWHRNTFADEKQCLVRVPGAYRLGFYRQS